MCIFQHMTCFVASVSSLAGEPPSPTSGGLRAGVLPTRQHVDAQLQSRLLTAEEARVRCWWLGVHGGAGETSLARLFAGVAAAEHLWPVSTEWRTSVVLVARTSFWGMRAAQAAMRDWSACYRERVDVLGLVLVADRPGRLPRVLRDLQRDLVGATPNLWLLPWVDTWTLGGIPSRENAPTREVEALRLGLTAALKSQPRRSRRLRAAFCPASASPDTKELGSDA
jgi:hypothetical protein